MAFVSSAHGSVTVSLSGDKALMRKFERLKSTTRRSIGRRAVQAGSTPILKAARKLVRRDTKQMRKSLGRKVKTYRGSGTSVAIIGPRSGFRAVVPDKHGKPKLREPIYYSHLEEFGTKHSSGSHFLEKALEQNKAAANNAMQSNLAGAIEREAAKN